MEEQKVRELAETLKKEGLAASMYDAMEKARCIIEEEEKSRAAEEERKKPTEEPQVKPEEQKESFFQRLRDKISHKEHTDAKKIEQPYYDVPREEVTVNELMKEVGVDPEKVRGMEKERLKEEANTLKEELMREESEGKKEKLDELKKRISDFEEEVEEFEEEQ
jgi:hypothetical protein